MSRAASLVALSVFLVGCNQMSCSEIESIARREAVRSYLQGWVDDRVRAGDYVLSENEDFGKVRLPGEYSINIPIDASILEMGEPEARPIIDKNRQAVSFFFGEYTYRGILVRSSQSDNYGFPENRLREIDERTAVVCIEH